MDSSLETSDSTQQKIVIPNRHNEKLIGLLHETGSKEIVVLCHGFRSNKNDQIMTNVAAAIAKEGISAFRFDFSGNGESEGSFYFGNYNHEADDLHSVIQYFSNMNRVVAIIVGHSKGGDVFLLYASKYNDISNVVNLSGRYDLKKGLAERLGEDFLEKIKHQGFIDVKNGIKRLELFDEFEEWRMMQEHYCVTYAVNDTMVRTCDMLNTSGTKQTPQLPPKSFSGKLSSPVAGEEELEIEIAEVLYGMSMPLATSKQESKLGQVSRDDLEVAVTGPTNSMDAPAILKENSLSRPFYNLSDLLPSSSSAVISSTTARPPQESATGGSWGHDSGEETQGCSVDLRAEACLCRKRKGNRLRPQNKTKIFRPHFFNKKK